MSSMQSGWHQARKLKQKLVVKYIHPADDSKVGLRASKQQKGRE